eukprot:3991019-Pleurochrysis_carterae.AAC.1
MRNGIRRSGASVRKQGREQTRKPRTTHAGPGGAAWALPRLVTSASGEFQRWVYTFGTKQTSGTRHNRARASKTRSMSAAMAICLYSCGDCARQAGEPK